MKMFYNRVAKSAQLSLLLLHEVYILIRVRYAIVQFLKKKKNSYSFRQIF